ncbi:MAG: uracil-DNA glycosylase, partial [Hyphomonadaceae bacterium]
MARLGAATRYKAPVEPDRRRAAEALIAWWELSGVDATEARARLRAALAGAARPAQPAPQAPPPTRAPAVPRVPSRAAPAAPHPADAADARTAASAAESLAALRAALEAYDGCPLKRTARNTVFADGVESAEVMLVGEAPGKEEDEQGKPFVGRSGQLLDRMFAAIGLSRESNLFLSNVIFWRPPGNRPPTQGETAACLPFIRRAIALKRPKMLVFVGGTAAQTMLARETGVMRLRGKRLVYTGEDGLAVNAMVMLHPAYLLRRPQEKRLAWADLL